MAISSQLEAVITAETIAHKLKSERISFDDLIKMTLWLEELNGFIGGLILDGDAPMSEELKRAVSSCTKVAS